MNLQHTQGDTYQQDLIFRIEWGPALNLTGASVFWTIRTSPESPIILEKQGNIVSSTEWKCVLSASAEEMNIPEGSYFYDYEIRWSDGRIETPLKGKFEITYQITKV